MKKMKFKHFKNYKIKENEYIMKVINTLSLHNSIPCSNCSKAYCCKQTRNISITQNEAKLLKKYITPKVKAKAEQQKIAFAFTGLFECPFLDENNRCSIYEVRPFVCAKYCVLEDTEEKCKDPKDSVHIVNMIEKFEEMGNFDMKAYLTDAANSINILDMF